MAVPMLFFLTLATFFLSGAHLPTFTITNHCPYTIWPATLTGGGGAQLSTTGFELASRASLPIIVPAHWSCQFWARGFYSTDSIGKFTCGSADCGSGAGAIPPANLVEFTLAAIGGQDFYDISLVDGFNLLVSVAPQDGSGGCISAACLVDVNANCPPELAVRNANGVAIACNNACWAFNQLQYCCTNSFGLPETCSPSKYSKFFKSNCPQGYSYAYDDKSSTFTGSGGANYLVTFCP